MKIQKKLLFVTVPVLALGIAGATLALRPADQTKDDKPVAKVQDVADTSASDQTTTETEDTTPVTPVESQPSAPSDTPADNKTKITQQITEYAASRGWSDSTTYAQTSCFDRAITSSIGYTSYDDLMNSDKFPMLSAYLAGNFMFDGATCKQQWLNQN